MGDRLVIALLSGLVGLLIGLFAPGLIPGTQDIAPAEQAWLNPAQPTPAPTTALLPRQVAAVTAIPPTLTAPPRPPTSTPAPDPEPALPTAVTARTFVIQLAGGGEMKVVANDEAAARNNVREQGGVPAN